MEPIVGESFAEYISKHHEHVLVKETELQVHLNDPYIGASPDSIVRCSFHGESLLDKKCPFKYKGDLKGWAFDKDFPSGEIKKLHRYYYQMQQQVFVTNKKPILFYIWSKCLKQKTFLLLEVPQDQELISTILKKYEQLFFGVILPELFTRKNCPNEVHDSNKFYCICKRPSFPPMIAYDGNNCHIEWFHYSCVKISMAPRGKWYCNNSLARKKIKVLILYLVNYFASFSVLIYEIQISLKNFVSSSIFSK